MRRDEITDEDLDHFAQTERLRSLSKQEEWIDNLDMSDVDEFLASLRASTELMQAIKDEDEHEVGSVIFDALRKRARDAT